MQATTVIPPHPIEIVIPDCCNVGVIFRSLLAVNGVIFTGILLRTSDISTAMLEFVESSMLIELSCLTSLLALCAVRRMIRTIPSWGQRIACFAIPAAVTGGFIHSLSSVDWLWTGFAYLTVFKGMLTAGALGLLLQHYFELRTRAYSPALVEARLQALQARIRPHFLFNSLNAALSLIRTEPRRAETTIEDLADLFRILMRDTRTMTSLSEEIRLCQQYLSIESIRLGDRLKIDWKIENLDESDLSKVQVPVLLLQPLLENAVHYGVEPAAEPTLINILVAGSVDRIQISISNPYHMGDVPDSGNHMALSNIRERLALLYDVEAQLTTAVKDNCFEVQLRFPYSAGVI